MLPLSSSTPFVKICGLTCAADAAVCAEAGADAIGINFFPESKRYHPLHLAQEWLGGLAGGPARVAVFVNAPVTEIQAVVDSALFEAIQLHGDESPDFCAAVKAFGLPLIRALALRSAGDLGLLADHPADAFILDAYAPASYGGTGQLSDWSLAAQAMLRFPDKTILLSGGLSPENVAEAILQVNPFGVDVASGVESSPGRKDPVKVRAFIACAKGEKANSLLIP